MERKNMGGMIELPDPNGEIAVEIAGKVSEALDICPKSQRSLRALLEEIQELANRIHVEYRPGAFGLPKEKTDPVDWSRMDSLTDVLRGKKRKR
jgi:hypothetical protein